MLQLLTMHVARQTMNELSAPRCEQIMHPEVATTWSIDHLYFYYKYTIYIQKPRPGPSQAGAKPWLVALAWPEVWQSQSRLKTGQSRGFQAKPGCAQPYMPVPLPDEWTAPFISPALIIPSLGKFLLAPSWESGRHSMSSLFYLLRKWLLLWQNLSEWFITLGQ